MKNKFKVLTLLAIFFIILLGILIYMYSYKENIQYVDNLNFEVYSKVYIKDLIKSDIKFNDKRVSTSSTGTKKIEFTYKNRFGFNKTGNITIGVVDTEAPSIVLNNSLYILKGSNTKLSDKIMCLDNYDDDVTINIKGDYDLNTAGKYNLSVTASDDAMNESTKDFTLYVYENTHSNNTTTSSGAYSNYTDFSKVVEEYKNNNTKVGIDISAWQKDIDFEALKNAGVEFVFIRAAVQSNIGEKLNLDKYFEKNIEKANKVGIDVGVYVFSKAQNKAEAIEQAKFIIKRVKKYDVSLPIVFDWENWSNYNAYHLSKYHLNEMANSFIKTLNMAGYEGMIYGSDNYLKLAFNNNFKNVWVARYGNMPSYTGFNYWQVCDDGKVSGIDTSVDIDIYYKN